MYVGHLELYTQFLSPKRQLTRYLIILEPFGPDSQNITDINSVTFYGKFDGERGIQTMRCGDYTYEQFVTPEWNHFVELAVRRGGPAARIMNAEREGYIK